jgi:hypothetical protein
VGRAYSAISVPTVISNNGETAIFSNKLVVVRNMPRLSRGVFGDMGKTILSIDDFKMVFKVGSTLPQAKLKKRNETLRSPARLGSLSNFLSSLFGTLSAINRRRSRSYLRVR